MADTARDKGTPGWKRSITARWPRLGSAVPSRACARQKAQSVYVADLATDRNDGTSPAGRAALVTGSRAQLGAPVLHDGRTSVGAITVHHRRPGHRLTDSRRAALESLAGVLSVWLSGTGGPSSRTRNTSPPGPRRCGPGRAADLSVDHGCGGTRMLARDNRRSRVRLPHPFGVPPLPMEHP
ncbi:GAF domain-containing protein [Streptomyces sp. NPDC001904]|uniref:GAF domain-containing protein n=1 Tax=Streptomyces sp. NPDC001904 TaxID=3154531 RepID=UPI00331A37A4